MARLPGVLGKLKAGSLQPAHLPASESKADTTRPAAARSDGAAAKCSVSTAQTTAAGGHQLVLQRAVSFVTGPGKRRREVTGC